MKVNKNNYNAYCALCDKNVDVIINYKTKKYKDDVMDIEYESKIAVCSECGEELFIDEISKYNQEMIKQKYQEKYEIPASVVKHLLNKAVEISYDNNDLLPYEYICWESILLDIEAEKPDIKLDKRELSQKDIDKLSLNEYTQNWFFDEIVSEDFGSFVEKLSKTLKENKYDIDLDKFVADNFDMVFTTKELTYQLVSFNIAAYLRYIKGDKDLAQILYSLGSNYAFLSNILRKSIYEYYVGKRYILKNKRNASNMFEAKLQPKNDDFELLQLDMIISMVEAKWVNNA